MSIGSSPGAPYTSHAARPGIPLRASVIMGGALFAWALVAWFWSRSPSAVGDMMGWRQADTQAIALNLLRPGASMLWPQIDWGGDGPGYVEAEFQLYTALAAAIMRVAGPVEWPGQLISLLSVLGCAVALWTHHGRREGVLAGGAAVAAFLGSRSVVQLSTAVQPDALALLLYTVAWLAFCEFSASGRRAPLASYGVFGALSMLVKPTNAQIGISSFLLLLMSGRSRLRRWELWLTWIAMLAALGLYLLHAKSLYDAYGNTFGILSGGDSKSPKLVHLLTPSVWGGAAKMSLFFGMGVLGAGALVWLTVKKQLGAEQIALWVANTLLLVMALRYTSAREGGHYYAPASVLGASATARLVQLHFSSERLRRWVLGSVFALAALQIVGAQWLRHRSRLPNIWMVIPIEAGEAARSLSEPGALIVVRSHEPTYDDYWQTANNYQDPTIFYISRTRGWEIGSDIDDTALLTGYVRRGATLFVDPFPNTMPPALAAWLAQEAKLLTTTPKGCKVWRLAR